MDWSLFFLLFAEAVDRKGYRGVVGVHLLLTAD
jgi:hypothetical protein